MIKKTKNLLIFLGFLIAILLVVLIFFVRNDRLAQKQKELELNTSLEEITTESLTEFTSRETTTTSQEKTSQTTKVIPKESEKTEADLIREKFENIRADIIQPKIDQYYGLIEVYFKILNTDQDLVYVHKEDKYIFPASLMKLYLMAGVFDAIDDGVLTYSDDIYDLLHDMITWSDNYAYNALLSIIEKADQGSPFERLVDLCKSYGFDDTIPYNFYVLENDAFAYLGKYLPEYTFQTSVSDLGLFYELLYKRELINQEASQAMLDLLALQTRDYKIPYYLPNQAIVYNKTGELIKESHDSALIESPNYDYILVIMTDGQGHDDAGNYLMQEMSREIYFHLNSVE